MKVKLLILAVVILATFITVDKMTAQENNMKKIQVSDNPPYHEIPAAPEKFTNNNVAARMIDGLGYRYYWATEGLTQKDLDYKISDDSRAASETLHHLYQLSLTIANGTQSIPNIRPSAVPEMDFDTKRRKTLENFKIASDVLKGSKRKHMKKMKVIFKRGEKQSEFPFWNLINGPIADAIYHTGQIVSYRRASGNPLNPKVNVFIGKNKK